MVGKEGAAKEPPQEGLKADPFHQAVKIFVFGMKTNVRFFLPVGFCFLQCFCCLGGGVVSLEDTGNVFLIVFCLCPKEQNIFGLFAGGERDGFKPKSAHGFRSSAFPWGRVSRVFLMDSPGMGKGAAFSDKIFYCGIEAFRGLAAAVYAHDIINPAAWPMAFFIKGHGRADENPLFFYKDAVEHGSYISVIPDVVCAASIDWDGGV